MATRRFQIFRKGTHRASDGTTRTYTDADMQKLVKAYDPAKMTAPLVFGHPKDDNPAFGAMVSVEYDEASGKLFGTFDHVPAEVDQQIKDRRWLAGSTSLYTENNPNNPVPGVLYPKHFGLLGAVPPAVKGMDGLLVHADDKQGAICIDFSDEDEAGPVARFMEAITTFLTRDHAEKKPYGDVEYADPANGKYPIDTEEHVRAAWSYINVAKNAAEYSESKLAEVKARIKAAAKKHGIEINEKDHKEPPMTEEEKKALEAKKYADLAAENVALKARIDAIDTSAKNIEKAGIVAHVEGLVKAGKVLPTFKAPLAELLMSLPNTAATLEHGEGDEKKTETPRAFLLSFLEASAVKFKEGRADLGAGPGEGKGLRGVQIPVGAQVDQESAKLHNEIVDYMEAENKKGNKLSYADAAIQYTSSQV